MTGQKSGSTSEEDFLVVGDANILTTSYSNCFTHLVIFAFLPSTEKVYISGCPYWSGIKQCHLKLWSLTLGTTTLEFSYIKCYWAFFLFVHRWRKSWNIAFHFICHLSALHSSRIRWYSIPHLTVLQRLSRFLYWSLRKLTFCCSSTEALHWIEQELSLG